MELKKGSNLNNGKYRILDVLGQGGFGITYLAEQTSLGRKVAVKEFFMREHCNRDAETSHVSVPSVGSREFVEKFRQKFIKEARTIASFDNRNIIRIHDIFEDNGTAYYVMEYLEGKSLKTLVDERGPLTENIALQYIREVADALSAVHSSKMLHLDLKPANIMLNKNGEAVLIDFGISKHYDEDGSQTSSGLIGLSDGYAPLEQYKKGGISSFSPATDIYALGATLYKLLTGKTPPHATDVNDDGLSELPVSISLPVRKAIEAAMQPRRKDRPESVEEFIGMLDREVKKEMPEKDKGKHNDDTVIIDDDKTIINDKTIIIEDKVPDKIPEKGKPAQGKSGNRYIAGIIASLSLIAGSLTTFLITPPRAFYRLDNDGEQVMTIFIVLAVAGALLLIFLSYSRKTSMIIGSSLLFLAIVNTCLIHMWNFSLTATYIVLSYILFTLSALAYMAVPIHKSLGLK